MSSVIKNHAISIRGEFIGIYEWGRGFISSDIQNSWEQFWREEFYRKRSYFWKYSPGDAFGGCGHLSSLSGSIYLHPMDFKTVLVSTSGVTSVSHSDGKDYYNHFGSELSDLKRICDECAKFCGRDCYFQLNISKEFLIEVESPDYEYQEGANVKDFGIEVESNKYKYEKI